MLCNDQCLFCLITKICIQTDIRLNTNLFHKAIMKWIVLLSMLALTTIISGDNAKPYFLSALLFVRDESSLILEYFRHYFEEGVDHVFIIDDGSTDGTIEKLSCINNQYYTILSHVSRITGPGSIKVQRQAYHNVFPTLQNLTTWLVIVDTDEFISSRKFPHLTLKQLLQTSFSNCSMVSAPWIMYAFGNHIETPIGSVRSSLDYRWSFDPTYARNVTNVESKAADIHQGIENKQIYHTDSISDVDVHTGMLRKTGSICGPFHPYHHNCLAGNCMIEKPQKAGGKGPIRMKITENDVDNLLLACHHYRITSLNDFKRKTQSKRVHSWLYTLNDSNRMDVHDNYMTRVRAAARTNHPQQKIADNIFFDC